MLKDRANEAQVKQERLLLMVEENKSLREKKDALAQETESITKDMAEARENEQSLIRQIGEIREQLLMLERTALEEQQIHEMLARNYESKLGAIDYEEAQLNDFVREIQVLDGKTSTMTQEIELRDKRTQEATADYEKSKAEHEALFLRAEDKDTRLIDISDQLTITFQEARDVNETLRIVRRRANDR